MFTKSVFEKDLGETLLMSSMFIITPLLMTFATTLMTTLTNAISTMCKWVFKQIELYWFRHKKCNVVIIEYRESLTGSTSTEDLRIKFLINSVLDYITKKNIYSPKMTCIVNEALVVNTSKDAVKNRKNILIPLTAIIFDEFQINTCKTESDKSVFFKMTISHPTSTKDIHNFLNMCVSVYIDDYYKIDNNQYFYELCTDVNNSTYYYSKYNISTNETTFDTIFFPEKQKIIELLDKLNDGKIKKLSLLLDGEPGVGKTSIIKAIAKKTGYSVISVKLSAVLSDHQFRNIFHNSMLRYHEKNNVVCGVAYDVVPLDKRIYILEDIDAESDIVHARSCTNEPVEQHLDSSAKENKANRSSLTLAGILNTLDGILEISKSIIIMTTNHKEKLDEALIRPGRITLSLHLTKMTSKCANMLINHIYGQSIDIRDGVFTPATLMSLCHITSDIDELKDLISKYTKIQQ